MLFTRYSNSFLIGVKKRVETVFVYPISYTAYLGKD